MIANLKYYDLISGSVSDSICVCEQNKEKACGKGGYNDVYVFL